MDERKITIDLDEAATTISGIVYPEYKSKLVLGDEGCQIVYFLSKRFNWFQKRMFSLCFGIKVEDVEKE